MDIDTILLDLEVLKQLNPNDKLAINLLPGNTSLSVDANSFFSWASSTNDNTSLMYGIEITDFGCYEIEAFTTDRNAGMPCRCIKGEDLVKWADFTDEETNKFPSTSLKWKTQKYESREEQLEKLNQTQPLNGW